MTAPETSIREARRRAALARDITAAHTGPWQTLEAHTLQQPMMMVGLALLTGIIAGLLFRR